MVAVASATKARPLTPNLPSHRDPYYAGKWQKSKADRYIDAVSPGTGESLGKVVEVQEFGAHPVLRVAGEGGSHLVPFVEAYVDAVDMAGRRIDVDWQKDY